MGSDGKNEEKEEDEEVSLCNYIAIAKVSVVMVVVHMFYKNMIVFNDRNGNDRIKWITTVEGFYQGDLSVWIKTNMSPKKYV